MKQEQSLDDGFAVETTGKELLAWCGIVTVALIVYYLVGRGILNLIIYLTK